ncbi:hypothetical protein CIK05_00925 [Bdellovibrio sp. qaytius]|nr:hypothetical protein CIK05_00925 [Bdellovibrio sp. qaytius]
MQLSKLYYDHERQCEFHEGFNIILGKNRLENGAAEKGRSTFSDTNGLGKSLIVNSIKYALAGESSSYFESTFFAENSLWIRLEVIVHGAKQLFIRPLSTELRDTFFVVFNGSLKEHLSHLKSLGQRIESIETASDVNLTFNSDKRYSVLTKEEYKKHLSKLENIDYSKGNLSFSSLLDFLIRDEKEGFSDPIARVGRQTWVQHRSAQYLFGLPFFLEESASDIQDRILEKLSILKSKQSELNSRGIKNIDKIENLEMQTHRKLDQLKKEINSLEITDSLEVVRKEYSENRLALMEVNLQITQKESYVDNYSNNLEDIKSKASALSELLAIDKFYDDLIGYFPVPIKQNFSNFSTFFESVSLDRKEYYQNLIQVLKREIKALKAEKIDVESKVQELAYQFKGTTIVRDVALLTSREEELKTELTHLSRFRHTLLECEAFESEIDALVKKREALLKQGKTEEVRSRNRRSELIKLFQELVLSIYETQDGTLEFDYISEQKSSIAGRTEILCSIPSQGSHGRTYGKINIFDFVWFLRNRESEEFDPEFLIHDGSYAKISREVKERMLQTIINKIGNKKQYIITLNEGEVQDLSKYQQYVCCILDGSSTEGKFFKEQF